MNEARRLVAEWIDHHVVRGDRGPTPVAPATKPFPLPNESRSSPWPGIARENTRSPVRAAMVQELLRPGFDCAGFDGFCENPPVLLDLSCIGHGEFADRHVERTAGSHIAGNASRITAAGVRARILVKIPGGDPAARIAGRTATEANIQDIREKLHLNDPFYSQYWAMMQSLFTK